ncbi:MAG: phosphoenolpyruvate carboxykinase (ATP) [Halobacteria archaeon]|nr:phosphoenolpyruvate carboxykinase (ATP) [Halobacteria archaeon]
MKNRFSNLKHAFPDPVESPNIIYNPSFDEMRSYSKGMETTTEYGSPCYVSDIKSRSADRTKNNVDHEFSEDDEIEMARALEHIRENEVVCVDRMVGRHPDNSYVCRYYVPKRYSRIALAWAKLLEPVKQDGNEVEPDFYTVQLPDWDKLMVRVLPEEGLTYVLGSDYTGEAKKSFLRLFMYYAKKKGGLGIHAGSKRVRIKRGGDLKTVGQLYLGLSATGKSTLTGHGFWLEEPEKAEMLQDDVCALLPNGSVAGSEGNGLYIKTIGLDSEREKQPELYQAVTQPQAVLENVCTGSDGGVDFDDGELTTNSRAVILRENLPNAADDIDLGNADQTFFITRNSLMPPIAKLNSKQAGVAFMLGESIQTSAGDPDKAGKSIRVVGTNPFIIGSEGEEGNRFVELAEKNDIECFVINTGHVGGKEKRDIRVEDTVRILRETARGTVEWKHDDITGLTIPDEVPGMDIGEFYPPSYFDDYESRIEEFREDRRQYLEQFDDLSDDIKNAVY